MRITFEKNSMKNFFAQMHAVWYMSAAVGHVYLMLHALFAVFVVNEIINFFNLLKHKGHNNNNFYTLQKKNARRKLHFWKARPAIFVLGGEKFLKVT